MVEMSSLKPNYNSTRKTSPGKSNSFVNSSDERGRRLQLQQLIAFRDKHRLPSDYELIYSIPRLKLQESMHFFCVFVCVGIVVCIFLYQNQDVLDIAAINDHLRQDVPSWMIYGMCFVCLSIFVAGKQSFNDFFLQIKSITRGVKHLIFSVVYDLFCTNSFTLFSKSKILRIILSTNAWRI